MTAPTFTPKNIRPLDSARIAPPVEMAEEASMGDTVMIGTDALGYQGDGQGFGLIVSVSNGTDTANEGDKVGVAIFGAVTGFDDLLPGRLYYLGSTPGELATTGSKKFGYALNTHTLIIMPDLATAAS